MKQYASFNKHCKERIQEELYSIDDIPYSQMEPVLSEACHASNVTMQETGYLSSDLA